MNSSASQVKISRGLWRGQTVSGVFPLVKGLKLGSKGSFITVLMNGATEHNRVYLNKGDFQILGADESTQETTPMPVASTEVDYEAKVRSTETREQAIARINRSFEIIEKMTRGAIKGVVRGLIVSGPAGIGKSWTVEETLSSNMKEDDFEVVKGASTPIALYQILYRNRSKGNVIVFDDCDNILFDDVSLNLLKAVLDTSEKRFVSWNAESRVLAESDIPNKFEFRGSVIFLTNLNFDKTNAKRLQPHLEALKSRCYYVDLGVSNQSDMLLRIESIVEGGMLADYDLGEEGEAEVLQFIRDNLAGLREISLRTVVKVAGLRSATPTEWKDMAINTVLRPEAKWKAMLADF